MCQDGEANGVQKETIGTEYTGQKLTCPQNECVTGVVELHGILFDAAPTIVCSIGKHLLFTETLVDRKANAINGSCDLKKRQVFHERKVAHEPSSTIPTVGSLEWQVWRDRPLREKVYHNCEIHVNLPSKVSADSHVLPWKEQWEEKRQENDSDIDSDRDTEKEIETKTQTPQSTTLVRPASNVRVSKLSLCGTIIVEDAQYARTSPNPSGLRQ